MEKTTCSGMENNMYDVNDFLSVFKIFKNPKDDFQLILTHDNISIIRVDDEIVETIDESERKNWNKTIYYSVPKWVEIEITDIKNGIKNDLFNFFSTREERNKIMSEEEWIEEMNNRSCKNK